VDVIGLISLPQKLVGYYIARTVKAYAGSVFGDWAYHDNDSSSHHDFNDDEDEMSDVTTRVKNAMLKKWVCSQNLSSKWKPFSVDLSEKDSMVARTDSMATALGWLLWRAAEVTAKGKLEARCKSKKPDVRCIRMRDLTWVWHDEMDALSQKQGGAGLEAFVDVFVDGGAAANYTFTITWADKDDDEWCFDCDDNLIQP
jgi:hypothetical protein